MKFAKQLLVDVKAQCKYAIEREQLRIADLEQKHQAEIKKLVDLIESNKVQIESIDAVLERLDDGSGS